MAIIKKARKGKLSESGAGKPARKAARVSTGGAATEPASTEPRRAARPAGRFAVPGKSTTGTRRSEATRGSVSSSSEGANTSGSKKKGGAAGTKTPVNGKPPANAKGPPKREKTKRVGVDVGDSAPSFVLQDQSGHVVSSESLRGAPYVIYFYPKDDTPGCTLEACGFRDSLPRFSAKGIHVLGVSADLPKTHARFKEKYDLTFPLLSDPEKTLAKAYGVWVKKQNYGREYMGIERSTFFVDRTGVVRKVWRGVRVPGHVDEVVHSV